MKAYKETKKEILTGDTYIYALPTICFKYKLNY